MSSPDLQFSWPALDLAGMPLPSQLSYERGIWGKLNGAASDYRWLAATTNLSAPDRKLEQELSLGPADAGDAKATLWRTIGDTSYAIAYYPSRSRDAAGRSGFLEQQVLEWKRPADLPAAIGALLLLPAAATLNDVEWWDRQEEFRWYEPDEMLDLDEPKRLVASEAIEGRIRDGLRALTAAVSEESLADLYAALLAGGRGIPLEGLRAPLPPAAIAALLLPLPRALADRISIAGWLPSSWLSDAAIDQVRGCWDLALGGATAFQGSPVEPTLDHIARGRAMAQSLFTAATNERSSDSAPAADLETKPLSLTLWGPTQAGKTVLLANLFLDADKDENNGVPRWQVFPTGISKSFIEEMRALMQKSNVFPQATAAAHIEGLQYVFRHTSGARALLYLEDRAGGESETLTDAMLQRLATADGLLLLFDLMAEELPLQERISRTIDSIILAGGEAGRKYDRPIAVCISKADRLLDTGDDYNKAVGSDSADEFVREKVPEALLRPIERYCSRYRFFPISAIGVRVQYGMLEPAVFLDEALQPRICPGSRPFNLMAPFTWLLHELTGLS